MSPNTANSRPRPPRVLLRSSWQTVNIGDIAHTPGILQLLRTHLPAVQVTLWPGRLDRGVREMLRHHFPALPLVEGETDAAGRPTTPELAAAFANHDFFLHGSGPSVVAVGHVAAWRQLTGRPYGIYGVTIDPLTMPDGHATEGGTIADLGRALAALPAGHLTEPPHRVLDQAAFVFCRETLTLGYLRAQGVATPHLDFAPDAAFGIAIRDEERTDRFLADHGLAVGRFICVIPRSRYTPYHLVHATPPTAEDLHRAAISARHLEADLAKLAVVIETWVRQTGHKVLLCPEMTYQVAIAQRLHGLLPPAIRTAVVCRPDYWLPDEAVATYARACALVSLDNHSPIFALAQGVPACYVRQPTDTTKGKMWEDVGLEDWFFEIENTTAAQISERLLAIHRDPAAAQVRVQGVMARVRARQRQSLQVVGDVLAGLPVA